uniref:glycosyltransferase n=1 Tax=Microbacterium sp. SORGH_AS_1204 TaxID=3041785 RepID=UPI0027D7AB9F|nr:glycosyltransferase [Microbacterium sp. SORGH_AS_1204]
MSILLDAAPETVLMCSAAHLDRSVRTGIESRQYRQIPMVRLFGRAFVQYGGLMTAMSARVLVVDLNPRSLTAWILLAIRRVLRRRSLVWGHLFPQAGSDSSTRMLRLAMRRLSNGTISYSYANKRQAELEMPDRPVWVAPNAIYTRSELSHALATDTERGALVYVGRFEHAKKVEVLIQAFSKSRAAAEGAMLHLVGDGSQREELSQLVSSLGLLSSVTFYGWIQDFEVLEGVYSTAFASTSPGFAGLGLTQSLGFGVPMIVSKGEPHSPEIELSETGGVLWADESTVEAWVEAINRAWASRTAPRPELRDFVVERYSADAMAEGLLLALADESY